MAAAVAIGPNSRPSVSSSTARWAPSASAPRSCSIAAAGPRVSTQTEPPCRSVIRTASSTAHSSCGLIENPDARVAASCPSGVTAILPPTVGTRLMQTRISMASQLRIRSFAGSNNGVAPARATVTGYCSPRYSTSSELPSTACSAGRYAISRCLPTEGPEPALVTYDGRPLASTRRSPAGDRIGSPPSMYPSDPSPHPWESTRRVHITPHRRPAPSPRVGVGGGPGAEGAVPLPRARGGPDHADAGRHQAVRLAGLPQGVPQPQALLDRHVQFPAELAHVGDPGREHHGAADLDLTAGAEPQPRARDGGGRHPRHPGPRSRAPHPHRRPAGGGGEVGQGAGGPNGRVLGVDDRGPPARLPFGRPPHQPARVAVKQRGVRCVPERPLPARRLVEHRVQRALPLVGRADPDRAAGFPLLGRVHDAVHLVEAFPGPGPDVLCGLLVRVQPPPFRLLPSP